MTRTVNNDYCLKQHNPFLVFVEIKYAFCEMGTESLHVMLQTCERRQAA